MKLRKAGIVTTVVVVILLIYAAIRLVSIHMQIESAKENQTELEEQAETMETSNAEMEYALENSDEDEVIAGIARDKLGLTYPEEEIFSED
jgi:cell division protein FtsB